MNDRKARLAKVRAELQLLSPGIQLQDAIPGLKRTIHRLIPDSFSWWLEIDADIGISTRWIWLGHPGVCRIGSVSDPDASIMLRLLQDTNWEEEVDAAIETVEAFEREALRIAQAKRRARVTSRDSLEPIQMPEPGPLTIEGKREQARKIIADSLKTKHSRKMIRQSSQPAFTPVPECDGIRRIRWKAPEKAPHAQLLPPTLRDELPEFGLSCSRLPNPRSCVWLSFESAKDLWHQVFIRPTGTFQRLVMFGCQWRTPALIEHVTQCGIIERHLTREEAATMTTEQFWTKKEEILSKVEIVTD